MKKFILVFLCAMLALTFSCTPMMAQDALTEPVFLPGKNVKSIGEVKYDAESKITVVNVTPTSPYGFTLEKKGSKYVLGGQKGKEYIYPWEKDGYIELHVSYSELTTYTVNLTEKATFKTSDSKKGTIAAVNWTSPSEVTLTLNLGYGQLYDKTIIPNGDPLGGDLITSSASATSGGVKIKSITEDGRTYVIHFRDRCTFAPGDYCSEVTSVEWIGEASARVTCKRDPEFGQLFSNTNGSNMYSGIGERDPEMAWTDAANVVTFTHLGKNIEYVMNFCLKKAYFFSTDDAAGVVSSVVWTAEDEATVTLAPAEGYELVSATREELHDYPVTRGATTLNVKVTRDLEVYRFTFAKATPDGIANLNAHDSNAYEVYDLTGKRISAMTHGIYVLRYSDGTTRKVVK